MARRVLVDSGPLVALLDRRDIHHQWVQHELANLHDPLVTCEAVLSEVFFLLSRIRGGSAVFIALLRDRLISPSANFSYQEQSAEMSQRIAFERKLQFLQAFSQVGRQ